MKSEWEKMPEKLLLSRRNFIASASAAVFTSIGDKRAFGADYPTLRGAAVKSGLLYGCAVRPDLLSSDETYAKLVSTQAGILVCESETKRGTIQPSSTRFNFGPTDAVTRFAQKNNQLMRGHTFIWHRSVPGWLSEELKTAPDERRVTDYISTVAKRYRGRFHSWDVVNEVVNPDDKGPNGMRTSSVWYQAFGERYIDLAFHAAKEADPDALLFYNEANTEHDVFWSERIRRASLSLIDRLIARKVPIEAFGIQGHLKAYRTKFDEEVFSRFLDEITARGLKILVTELDIADIGGPADPEQRDAQIGSLTKRFLDVVFSKKEALGCLTWGITDRASWLSADDNYKWASGELSRGLPFDGNYQPKRMFDTMMMAYRGAPVHR